MNPKTHTYVTSTTIIHPKFKVNIREHLDYIAFEWMNRSTWEFKIVEQARPTSDRGIFLNNLVSMDEAEQKKTLEQLAIQHGIITPEDLEQTAKG